MGLADLGSYGLDDLKDTLLHCTPDRQGVYRPLKVSSIAGMHFLTAVQIVNFYKAESTRMARESVVENRKVTMSNCDLLKCMRRQLECLGDGDVYRNPRRTVCTISQSQRRCQTRDLSRLHCKCDKYRFRPYRRAS